MPLVMTVNQGVPAFLELQNVGGKPWDGNTRIGTTFSLLALSAPVRDDTLSALRTHRAFEIARDTLQLPG